MRHNFKELIIWKLAMELSKRTYQIIARFPVEERYGLISQMRRAAVSIPSNIAEGCGRGTDMQLSHFLDIAIGSSCELETQYLLAVELQYLTQTDMTLLNETLHEFQRRTRAFKNTLIQKDK